MGFMDKAKKLAEQAQAKLDEAQGQFNAGQAGGPAEGAPVEYDKHGRPIQSPTPDPGAPATTTPGVPPTTSAPTPDPGAPAAPKPPAPPSAVTTPGGPPAPEDRNHPSTEPPKLSSGDPLAG